MTVSQFFKFWTWTVDNCPLLNPTCAKPSSPWWTSPLSTRNRPSSSLAGTNNNLTRHFNQKEIYLFSTQNSKKFKMLKPSFLGTIATPSASHKNQARKRCACAAEILQPRFIPYHFFYLLWFLGLLENTSLGQYHFPKIFLPWVWQRTDTKQCGFVNQHFHILNTSTIFWHWTCHSAGSFSRWSFYCMVISDKYDFSANFSDIMGPSFSFEYPDILIFKFSSYFE